MILAQGPGLQAKQRDQKQRSESDDLGNPAGVLKPFPNSQAQHRHHDQEPDQRARYQQDEPLVRTQSAIAECVRDVGRDGHSLR